MNEDQPNARSREGLDERTRQLDRIENEIQHDRKEEEFLGEFQGGKGKADEEPQGYYPGPHARILEPQKITLGTEEGETEQFLEFEVILPDRSYGSLIVEYPVPEPGPFLKLVYRFFDIPPGERSPTKLFKQDIPVRPIEDEPGKGCWVLDLPPGISSPHPNPGSLNRIQQSISQIPQGSDHLYLLRRRAEEFGIVTWENEGKPRKRLFPDDEEEREVDRLQEEVAQEEHIGFIFPTCPNLSLRGKVFLYGPFLGSIALSGSVGIPYLDSIRSGSIITIIILFIISYIFTTYSVRREI